MLRAGTARSIITPPVGMTMAGYAAREGAAIDKDDELSATALVLDDERTRIAIMALDLIFIKEPLVSTLRGKVGQRLGVPGSHVLLNFSHTHCGPTSEGLQYDDDEQQDVLRQTYSTRLLAELPALAAQAVHRLQPARIGTGVGEARIGINRRERQADGSIILGENPAGPVDHEVRVIRVDGLNGRPIAVVFSHGCHTVTMGPKCLRWSSDYVGPARELVERAVGGLSLFLQANAGDINPVTGIGTSEDNTNEKNRLGFALGGEVLKVLASIYTESVRGQRTFIGSLSKIPYYPRIPITKEPDHAIEVKEEMLELQLGSFPQRHEADEILERWDSEVSSPIKSRTTGAPMNVARHFRHWARTLHEAVLGGLKPAVQIPIQAIRVGNLGVVAVPGETFTSQGVEVKKQSPFPHTLFIGYSNGCLAYIPTRDAYPAGGWSLRERYYVPDMIFQAYLLPTALAPDSSERVVNKSVELLRQLHA